MFISFVGNAMCRRISNNGHEHLFKPTLVLIQPKQNEKAGMHQKFGTEFRVKNIDYQKS